MDSPEWTERLHAIPGLNVTIADVLQKEATPQDFLDHIDIADWLLRTRERPVVEDGRRHSRTFLEIQEYISPEVADQVEALIDDLGLEFFGKVEKVEVEEGPTALGSLLSHVSYGTGHLFVLELFIRRFMPYSLLSLKQLFTLRFVFPEKHL